jgi:hypothetical protein
MRKLLLCTLAVAALCGAVLAHRPKPAVAGPQPDPTILRDIRTYRATTWHYQELMGVERTPPYAVKTPLPVLRTRWKQHAARAWKHFRSGPAHQRQWLCIHRYEGSWHDPHEPYYGGLQMNISFQRTYGGRLLRKKGTADHWSPLEQMWVAERAYRSGRGFYPWPNTARYCGLI